MASNNLQESLKTLSPMLNDVVRKAIGKDLAWQRGYRYPGGFSLQDVAKVFKVTVSPSNRGLFQFKGWDVSPADDLIVGVHFSRVTMSLRVSHFNFQKVLRNTVNLIKCLLLNLGTCFKALVNFLTIGLRH